jgi:large subunit ribosomal protein L21
MIPLFFLRSGGNINNIINPPEPFFFKRGHLKNMLAIIKTGGKQYKVSPGQKIKIEKLEIPEGQEVIFDNVLLVEKDKEIEIGQPIVKSMKVVGKVLKQGKGDKVIVFKYKPKKRYKVKKGHRQLFTEVEIVEIK